MYDASPERDSRKGNSKSRVTVGDSLETARSTIDALRTQREIVGKEIAKQENELCDVRATLVKMQVRMAEMQVGRLDI